MTDEINFWYHNGKTRLWKSYDEYFWLKVETKSKHD